MLPIGTDTTPAGTGASEIPAEAQIPTEHLLFAELSCAGRQTHDLDPPLRDRA